jgi:hypothetical protein
VLVAVRVVEDLEPLADSSLRTGHQTVILARNEEIEYKAEAVTTMTEKCETESTRWETGLTGGNNNLKMRCQDKFILLHPDELDDGRAAASTHYQGLTFSNAQCCPTDRRTLLANGLFMLAI